MSIIALSPWNSLEIAKIIVAILTPILIVGMGLIINKSLVKIEYNQWRNQKLIEKRIAVYDDLAPDLNDLLCYFTRVGNWKKIRPTEIIEQKRKVDRKLHLSAPLFSDDYFEACNRFISLCFETHTGSGKDAKLRTDFDDRKIAFGNGWNSEWELLFCEYQKRTKSVEIRKSYSELIKIFAREMGLNPGKVPSLKNKVMGNLK